jgi:hypothetical protein
MGENQRAKAKHLTWDLYNDLEHPYTRLKISNLLRKSGSTIFTVA